MRDGRESNYYSYSPREGTAANGNRVNDSNASATITATATTTTTASTSSPVEVRRVRKHTASHDGNSVNDGVKSLEVPSAAEGAVVRVKNSSSSSDSDDDNNIDSNVY